MKRVVVPLLLAMTGCMAQAPAEQAQALPQGALRCIDLRKVIARRIEPGALLYQLQGGITYRNDLGGTCPSLKRANGSEVVQTETQSQDLCRDDNVRIYDAAEVQGVGPTAFPKRRVGDFVPVAGR